MNTIIAVAGKGGSGKTTISALIIRSLLKRNKTPILAIDADPNSNLAESLGIDVQESIGTALSDFLRNRADIPQGMTKQAFLELKLHQILKEGKDIDMFAMGVPEGPGCYCAANAMLRDYFENLSKNYKYVVIDNEAGMEHFSRKTAAEIDILLFCSSYSLKGLKTISRLSDMVDKLRIGVKDRYLLVNRSPDKLDKGFLDAVKEMGIPFLGHIVTDKSIEDSEIKGIPLMDMPDDSKTVRNVDSILDKVIK